MRVDLPYGSRPLSVDLGAREVAVVRAPAMPAARPVRELIEEALASPIGGSWPAVARGARVTLIVSDATRAEPRGELVAALRRRLPDVRLTIAIATGTHGPARLEALDIAPDLLAGATIVNHNGHRADDLVDLGTTIRGTPVRVHRCVVEADLVLATGCIRPHYFAGFGAGVKAIFPGLGEATAIRANHRLKQEPGARAGVIDGNPCRDDLEDAVSRVRVPTFLVNAVAGPDGAIHAVVAGDLRAAFRAGVALARPWFTVRAPRGSLVLASDRLPVTASLYQSAKIAAAAAPLVAEGGTLVVVAECRDGVGPLATVNEAIFRIGVLPRLARGVRLVLVSSLDQATVSRTLLTRAASIEDVLVSQTGPVVVIPEASQLVTEAAS
ncbi:MAG: lactate racemase domain-containing protein [Acidobacteriota bacterium]